MKAKEQLYDGLHRPGGDWDRLRYACNLWTAAFFLPMVPSVTAGLEPLFPTSATVNAALEGAPPHGKLVGAVADVAARVEFFHWPLEFPDVLQDGGFDVILANPPWERVKLQEQEFFAAYDPAIANAPNKAARQRLIDQLGTCNPDLFHLFENARHDAEAASKILRGGGRYPLTGRGDVNTYSVFAELMTQSSGKHGRAGVIVPSGIATDDTNKRFFGWLIENHRLGSMYDFENREDLFQGSGARSLQVLTPNDVRATHDKFILLGRLFPDATGPTA